MTCSVGFVSPIHVICLGLDLTDAWVVDWCWCCWCCTRRGLRRIVASSLWLSVQGGQIAEGKRERVNQILLVLAITDASSEIMGVELRILKGCYAPWTNLFTLLLLHVTVLWTLIELWGLLRIGWRFSPTAGGRLTLPTKKGKHPAAALYMKEDALELVSRCKTIPSPTGFDNRDWAHSFCLVLMLQSGYRRHL